MLCERQRTSRQAGSCTEALGTWLFNFNMQQGQAERIWEWLDCPPQRKSGIGKGKGAAIAKCSEVLGRRGHIDYIFNISLIFCSEYSAIWVESTQKGSKIQQLETTKTWQQIPDPNHSHMNPRRLWIALCERLLVCSDATKNRFQPPGFLLLGREAVRGLILAPRRDGNSE